MHIRSAIPDDFEELYAFGRSTPELRVSADQEFMSPEEFRWSLTNPHGVFLIAENEELSDDNENRFLGFIYASTQDAEKPFPEKYACMIYLAVRPESRNQGIAALLYKECEKLLKSRGITHLYGWAHSEGKGEIIRFMKKHGFAEGHRYVWMDKKIADREEYI